MSAVGPVPIPVPAPVPSAADGARSLWRDLLTPIAVLALAGALVFNSLHRPSPAPAVPVVDGVALGRAFAPSLAATHALAWEAAAGALEKGGSVSDAQKAMTDTWKARRTERFYAIVAPEFGKVLPAGSEPTDPAKRAEVVALWKAFAVGLKGAK